MGSTLPPIPFRIFYRGCLCHRNFVDVLIQKSATVSAKSFVFDMLIDQLGSERISVEIGQTEFQVYSCNFLRFLCKITPITAK
jgi:hypothetical protein